MYDRSREGNNSALSQDDDVLDTECPICCEERMLVTVCKCQKAICLECTQQLPPGSVCPFCRQRLADAPPTHVVSMETEGTHASVANEEGGQTSPQVPQNVLMPAAEVSVPAHVEHARVIHTRNDEPEMEAFFGEED